MADTAEHGFTPAQLAWLEKRFNAIRPVADRGFDRATIMWMLGGLTALGVAASSILYTEIGSVREELRREIGSVRTEIGSVREELGTEISSLRTEIGSLRDQAQANTVALARIEVILNERLPRDRRRRATAAESRASL